MKILISGSIAYDSIMDFPDRFRNHILPDKIHNLNVSFLIKSLKINYGGTAGNIAYNLSLLGGDPYIISTAGKDFGKYKRWMEENKLNTSGIKIIEKEFTALAHIITDLDNNQITAFYPGSMKYSGGKIKKEVLNDSFAIISPGFKGDMIDYAKFYQKKKVNYIFDPGQQIPAFNKKELKEIIGGAKVFISNDYELSLVMEKTGWKEYDILRKVEILVTTLGEKGSVIKTKKETFQIPPAKPKTVKDPTGAGDAYRAGFIKGLIMRYSLEKAGRLGSIVSAYAVEKYGTQNHKFSWKNIEKKYRENFKDKL